MKRFLHSFFMIILLLTGAHALAQPVADFSLPDTVFCWTDSFQTTNNSIGANTYSWDFGDLNTSNQFEPKHAYADSGWYTIWLIAEDTISGLMDSASQVVRVWPYAQAVVQPVPPFCPTDTVQVFASGGNTYWWLTNEYISDEFIADPFINVPFSQTIQVIVSYDGYCNWVENVPLTVHIPNPIFISYQGGMLHADSGWSAYQWYNDDLPVVGAWDSVYTPTNNGTWHVVAIDSNGCESTSGSITIGDVGLAEAKENKLVFETFPNPADEALFVRLPVYAEEVVITITDVNGRELKMLSPNGEGGQLYTVPLEELPAGLYILSVNGNELSGYARFVKR